MCCHNSTLEELNMCLCVFVSSVASLGEDSWNLVPDFHQNVCPCNFAGFSLYLHAIINHGSWVLLANHWIWRWSQGPSVEMNTKCHGKNIRKRTKKVRYADLNNKLLKENYFQTIEHMLTSCFFLKSFEAACNKIMHNNTVWFHYIKIYIWTQGNRLGRIQQNINSCFFQMKW